MKLNKDTKHALQIGDQLKDTVTYYTVIDLVTYNGRSYYITAKDQHGRMIYNTPLSSWCGAEIIKGGA